MCCGCFCRTICSVALALALALSLVFYLAFNWFTGYINKTINDAKDMFPSLFDPSQENVQYISNDFGSWAFSLPIAFSLAFSFALALKCACSLKCCCSWLGCCLGSEDCNKGRKDHKNQARSVFKGKKFSKRHIIELI